MLRAALGSAGQRRAPRTRGGHDGNEVLVLWAERWPMQWRNDCPMPARTPQVLAGVVTSGER